MIFANLFLLYGQEKITFDFRNEKVSTALLYLNENHGLIIVYPDDIDGYTQSSICNNCNVEKALSSILEETGLSYRKLGDQYIVYLKKEKISFSVYGRAIDKESGEPIPYANIHIPHLKVGDISRQDGLFSIPKVSGNLCTLIVSYIGYETIVKELQFPKDEATFHEIRLGPKVINSDQVSILGSNREFMDYSKIPGQISFSPKHIATLPNLGEVDIFRSIQYLPGVQLALGSTSGLYVRGGSTDHNLISLDGMTLYQTSHMFGFLSSISTETLKDVQIFKGHIPANFGGRTSSVIELTSRSGNSENFKGSLYGNFMSNGILAEIPIFKKGSIIFNFRQSRPSSRFSKVYDSIEKYMTVDNRFNLIKETGKKNINQSTKYDLLSSYNDYFSRFSYLINPKHMVTYTVLSGRDSIFEDRSYYGFSNILESDTSYIEEKNSLRSFGQNINLFSIWNNKYNTHLSISSYSYENMYLSKQSTPNNSNISVVGTADNFHSLSDYSIRFIQQYKTKNNHNISVGFEENSFSTHFENKNTESISFNSLSKIENGYLYSFFIKDSWNVFNNWEFDTGIRFSYFNNLENFYFEPRIAITYKIKEKLSFNLSYGVHNQFIHRLEKFKISNYSNNIWFLSSPRIPVILSTNLQSGFIWDKKDYSFSIVFYRKEMKKFFQLKRSFSIQDYLSYDDEIIDPGNGKTNGLEIQLRKKYGLVSGWVSYHNSSVKYKISEFNEDEFFSADHDKNHELKTVVLGKFFNTDISASWVFSSGRPFTELENLYVESGTGYEIFVIRRYNDQQIQYTHHLDISLSKTHRISNLRVDFGFSVYNLLNKNNIAYKRYNPFARELSIKDISMFGITPSVFTKIHF